MALTQLLGLLLPCSCGCSLQIKAVERFVVVHGAIIVSQLKLFPNKFISQSAFVGSLKTAMEARRHSKLYTALKKAVRVKGVNRNPMKVIAWLPSCCRSIC